MRLASVSGGQKAKIWDVGSGEGLYTFRTLSPSITFSHDLTRLADVLHDNTVGIWDTSSFAYLHTLENHGKIRLIAFSYDSVQLASASYDGTVKIWDASSSALLQTHEEHKDDVSSLTFLQDSVQQILDTTHCTCSDLSAYCFFRQVLH